MFLMERDGKIYMESGRLEHLCFSWKETGKFTCLHGKEH